MSRKCKYKVVPAKRENVYLIQKSGRTIHRVDTKRNAEAWLLGYTGLDVLPPSFHRIGVFYA